MSDTRPLARAQNPTPPAGTAKARRRWAPGASVADRRAALRERLVLAHLAQGIYGDNAINGAKQLEAYITATVTAEGPMP